MAYRRHIKEQVALSIVTSSVYHVIRWSVEFSSPRRNIDRPLTSPGLLCCGEAAAVRTRVPAEAEFFEIVPHPRLLIYDARCLSCRAMPHEQQEALIEAALALACRQNIDEERGGDHAQASIPASA